jgi:hypothetical protein
MADKQSFLKIEQLAHVAQTREKPVSYGAFRFTVPLCLDKESKWLIGRCPDLGLYPHHESIYCIYLPSLYLTRSLAVIHSTKSVYNDVHIIQCLSDKQIFVDSTTNEAFTQKPLRNNDRFHIANLPCYHFKYILVEEKEVSGELREQTIY